LPVDVATQPGRNLELKRCTTNNNNNITLIAEENRTADAVSFMNPITMDEYLTSSLYGTINRLISNQNSACLSMSSSESVMNRTYSMARTLEVSEGMRGGVSGVRNSTSYILPNDTSDDSGEIHF